VGDWYPFERARRARCQPGVGSTGLRQRHLLRPIKKRAEVALGLHAGEKVLGRFHSRNLTLAQLAGQFGDRQVMQFSRISHGVHRLQLLDYLGHQKQA